MRRQVKILLLVLCLVLLLSGCGLRTVDELYCLPERSDADNDLQKVIDIAMDGLEYYPPRGGNRQVTQKVDLDGDQIDECLVFAREKNTKDLKILVFGQLASGYVLMDTIEGNCMAFDYISYAQLDGEPGMEIVVGRQLGDEVTRSLSVYRFSSEHAYELLQTSYERLLLCNYDADDVSELLISKKQTEDTAAKLVLYQMHEGNIQATAAVELSFDIREIKMVVNGKLDSGTDAIFVTGSTDKDAILTDIFLLEAGAFRKVHTTAPIQALGGYSLYPEDLDADGILELPELVSMPLHPEQDQQQHFVRWYTVDEAGKRTEDIFTYMNLTEGWYLTLESRWAEVVSVVHSENESIFYLWDAGHQISRKLMTIYAMDEDVWRQLANAKEYMLLHESEAVVYAARLSDAADGYNLTAQKLADSFRMMRTERNTDDK